MDIILDARGLDGKIKWAELITEKKLNDTQYQEMRKIRNKVVHKGEEATLIESKKSFETIFKILIKCGMQPNFLCDIENISMRFFQ